MNNSMGIYDAIAGIKNLCGSVKQGVSLVSLLIRLKSWIGRFVGVENLMRDDGRLWVNEGFTLAGEGAAMTPTPIDDDVIARCKKVLASQAGFTATTTLIRLAFDIPEFVSGDAEYSTADNMLIIARQIRSTDVEVGGDDQTADDPLTVLTIIYVCLQIARLVRERAETRRERKAAIGEAYNGIGKKIAKRIINPAAIGSANQ